MESLCNPRYYLFVCTDSKSPVRTTQKQEEISRLKRHVHQSNLHQPINLAIVRSSYGKKISRAQATPHEYRTARVKHLFYEHCYDDSSMTLPLACTQYRRQDVDISAIRGFAPTRGTLERAEKTAQRWGLGLSTGASGRPV